MFLHVFVTFLVPFVSLLGTSLKVSCMSQRYVHDIQMIREMEKLTIDSRSYEC